MKYKRCGECKNFTAHFMTTVCCDCEFMSNFEQKPPMTNGDRIRAMSDEELAKFIPDWSYTNACKLSEEAYVDCNNECEKCVAEWLKQPMETADEHS